jgi:hypothetical protein
MPKRVVDGEGLWRSDKLARVEPPRWRAEFANLLPLAFANGVFEANPRRIWATAYSYNRADVVPEEVEAILNELERVKMLFRWSDQGTGKVWGYWVGSERPGRLPSPSRLKKRHELLGPEPPEEKLREFLSRSEPMANLGVSNGCLGFGVGVGCGIGNGLGFGVAPPKDGGAPSSVAVASHAVSALPAAKRNSEHSPEALRLTALLRHEILSNKPDSHITAAQLENWAKTADRMLRIDRRNEERIAAVICWAQGDEFWQTIILSMTKVRKHFDALELKMAQKGGRGNGRSLSEQATESVAGAARLFDAKAKELERAFGNNLRGGRKARA